MGKQFNKQQLACQLIVGLTLGSSCFLPLAWAAEGDALEEYSLDDIVVTADREQVKMFNAPAQVETVTAQEIEDNHYNDLSEALSHVSGVVTENTGDNDRITINGDERVVILVDGQRMNSDFGANSGKATGSLKFLPSLKSVDRIEVVQGGASAVYGADAVGGVINIITREAAKERITLDVSTGSWGTYNYAGSLEASEGKFSAIMELGLEKQNHIRYKLNGNTKAAPHSGHDNNNFSLRLKQKFDKSSSLALNFLHKSVHQSMYYNTITPGSFYGEPADGRWVEVNNDVTLQYNFKQNTTVPGYLRVFNKNRSAHYNPEVIYNRTKMETQEYGVDYQNGWKLGNNTLIAGAEWHESKSSSHPEGGTGFSDKKLRSFSMYLQDTWKIDKKWSFVPGLRMENHNTFGTNWAPKAAISYEADAGTKIFASWGKVFRAPTASDLYADIPGMGQGNPNLKAETGHTETIGFTHNFNKNSSLSLTLFNTVLNDAIQWGFDGSTWTTLNMSREKRRGLNINYNHRLSKQWSFNLGYSALHQEGEGAADYTTGSAAANKEPNAYHFGVSYSQGPWKSNLHIKNISGLDNKYYLRRSYTTVDWNINYELDKQTTVYFKVNNLTNQEYSTYMTTDGLFYPANGRFFQIGVTYTF